MTIGHLDPAALWLAGALALGIAELLVPGVFLIFLAVAAGVTALTTWALPDLPIGLQLADFAVWSVVCVFIGRRWYWLRIHRPQVCLPDLRIRFSRDKRHTAVRKATLRQSIAPSLGEVPFHPAAHLYPNGR